MAEAGSNKLVLGVASWFILLRSQILTDFHTQVIQ